MKPHLDIKHDGNLAVEGRTTMTFDENSIAHLMSILTDLYSDPELAVIREYSTNAWDSHRAAGIDAPIKVSLPSSLNPIFTVADHGLGMSLDDVLNYFAKYGASSKRDTDDEVGMLGLGCKSALTYTSQFSLTAIKGGVKIIVLVTRLETGAGAVQVMDTVATDEPNGVMVSIPVKNVSDFNRRARDFYWYWDPGTVEVDGLPIASIWESTDVQVLDPDVLVIKGGGYGRIVMGNVSYPTRTSMIDSHNSHVVVRVPIGSVNFTPSREALQYTKRTEEVVATVKTFVEDTIFKKAQADVDDSVDHYVAMVRATDWRSHHRGMNRLTFRGRDIPHYFTTPGEKTWRWNSGSHIEEPSAKVGSVSVDDAINTWHVIGFPQPYVTQLTKLKVQKFRQEQDPEVLRARVFHFHKDPQFGMPWLRGQANIIHWDRIKDIEVDHTRVSSGYGRAKGKYRVVRDDKNYGWTDEVPENAVWAFTHQVEHARQRYGRAVGRCGAVLVAITPKQEKKFREENPGVLHASTWVVARIKEFVAGLTEMDRFRLTESSTLDGCGIAALKDERLLDPELCWVRDLARTMKNQRSDKAKERHDRLQSMAAMFHKSMPDIESTGYDERINAAVEPYVFLTEGSLHFYYNSNRERGSECRFFAEYANNQYIVRNQLHLLPQTY